MATYSQVSRGLTAVFAGLGWLGAAGSAALAAWAGDGMVQWVFLGLAAANLLGAVPNTFDAVLGDD